MTIGAGITLAAIWVPITVLAYKAPLLAFGAIAFAIFPTEIIIKKSTVL